MSGRPLRDPPTAEPDVGRRINRELASVLGWGRAILLQLAHPLVAAGVAEHSSFRAGPFASVVRLHSTIGAMLDLTFGSPAEVERAAAGINAIHDRVHGVLPSPAGSLPAGTPYSAHDPELLCWVHATLLESLPLAYELFVGPLSPAEQDRFCVESKVLGPLLGIPDALMPTSQAQTRAYIAGMIEAGTVQVTPAARELAGYVLRPPWGPLAWPAVRVIRLASLGRLPPAIREGYGFAWDARDERALRRWARASRLAHRALPRWVHEWPAARRAAGRGRTRGERQRR